MSRRRATDDPDVTSLFERHYRPEPMSHREQEALMARVRQRAEGERTVRRTASSLLGLERVHWGSVRRSRIVWGIAATAAAACVLALRLGTPFAVPGERPATTAAPLAATTARAHDGLDAPPAELESLLIPTEAYAADTSAWARAELPADYVAIEDLLLIP